MKRILTIFTAGVPLVVAAYLPTGASADTGSSAAAPFTCSSISVKAPAGTTVESVTAVSREAGPVNVPAGRNACGSTVSADPSATRSSTRTAEVFDFVRKGQITPRIGERYALADAAKHTRTSNPDARQGNCCSLP